MGGQDEVCHLLTFHLFVVSAAATEMSHKDAGRGELCVESRIRKIYFNTLGESGRVAGGRVETL